MSKYHPSKRHGCDCDKCQALCRHEPGWFMPDEIAAAADHEHMSIAEFQEKCLQSHDCDGIVMFSPRQRPDQSCIFFKGGKCAIHSVKPFECQKVFGCEADRRHRRVREEMVKRVKTF